MNAATIILAFAVSDCVLSLQICNKDSGFICGYDGHQYNSECALLKKGVNMLHSGKCTCADRCLKKEREPVCCPVDNVVYFNKCQAKCNGLDVDDCIPHTSPVCGTDGRNYENMCLVAKEDGVSVRCVGQCPCRECICISLYQPVCTMYRTFNNQCQAVCAKADILCQGPCPCSDLPDV